MKKLINIFLLIIICSFTSCSSVKNRQSLDQGQHVILTPKITKWIDSYNNDWVPFYQKTIEKEKRIIKKPRSIKRWRKLKKINDRKKYIRLFSSRLKWMIDHEMLISGYSKQTRREIVGSLQLNP